jgi:hypothetical protein
MVEPMAIGIPIIANDIERTANFAKTEAETGK